MSYKIKVILTDENGNDYVGEVVLSAPPRKVKDKNVKTKTVQVTKSVQTPLDFDLSIQAFMKKVGAKHLSGPVKITALIAYLAKGNTSTSVKATDARKQWLRMRSVLGKFNTFYFTPAKENAWIHPVATASYKIRKEGLEIIREKI